MAISSNTRIICNKMSSQFDAIYNPIKRASNTIQGEINDAISGLGGMVFSPDDVLNSAIRTFEDNARGLIPDISNSGIYDILNIIRQCTYLNGDSILGNARSLLNSCMKGILDGISDLTSGLLDEFDNGNLLSGIQSLLSSLGIPSGILNLDKIINCVSSICGSSYTSRVNEMILYTDDLYSSLSLDSNPISPTYGQLDLSSIYSQAGLDASKIISMNKVIDSINGQKTLALNQLNEAKNILKDYI